MSGTRAVKIGLGLPDAEGTMNGASSRWSDLLAWAQAADQLGYDSIWNQDHLIFRNAPWMEPGAPSEGVHECWSVLAALAAVTTRVEIGPLVSCTSFRNPALLAKIADTVDEISGGRLVLGLGAGWHEPEYHAFDYPFDRRVSRFEEAVGIIHSLLKTGHADVEGQFYSARDCELRPRGPRPDGPPIMIGTSGDRMLSLTARFADRWNGYFHKAAHLPNELGPVLSKVDAACEAVGRDPKTLQRSFAVYVDVDGTAPISNSVNVSAAEPIRGSDEAIAETLHGYADVGVSHLQVHLHPMTLDSVHRFAPVLDLLDD